MASSSRREFFGIAAAQTAIAGTELRAGARPPAPARALTLDVNRDLLVWCVEPQRRISGMSRPWFKPDANLRIGACRGERAFAQLGVVSSRHTELTASLGELTSAAGKKISLNCRARAADYIPCQELGMAVADPLREVPTIELRAGEAKGIWLDFAVPAESPAGTYEGSLLLRSDARTLRNVPLRLEVLPHTLPEPSRFDFFLSIWQDPGSIARYYKAPLWSAKHWNLIKAFARNSAAHGQKTITTTVVEDPWSSQTGFAFPSMVQWIYPGEWSLGSQARFRFDYTVFDKYVETYMGEGIKIINCFSPAHWSPLAYFDEKARKTRYRKYGAGSEWWAAAWNQFLPDLIGHLRQRGWLENTYLAMDEADGETMEKVWPLLRRYSSDLKIHLAGGGGRYGSEAEDLCYYYFSLFDGKPEFPKPDPGWRRREGKRTTLYVCTGPTHPNNFLYSPAYGSRMLPWQVWKLGYDGFLRWALNSWPARLWEQPNYRWSSGDMFLVYPGPDGAMDSIRWELLFAGIQDYECLRLATRALDEREQSGAHRESAMRLRTEIERTVALAARDEDPCITDRESNIARARAAINRVLAELGRA